MKKFLFITVIIVVCGTMETIQAQMYFKKDNQLELFFGGSSNLNGYGGSIGLRHAYGSSSFVGRFSNDLLMTNTFSSDKEININGITFFSSYSIGYSLLKTLTQATKMPLDVSMGLGIGLGYDSYTAKSELLKNVPSNSSFIYGGLSNIELEYIFSSKMGIYVNYATIFVINPIYSSNFKHILSLGLNIKF